MKKIFILILLSITILIVGTYWYLDIIAKNAIESYGSAAMGVPIKIKRVKVNFLHEEFKIYDIEISNPPGYEGLNLMTIGHIGASIDLKSIFEKTIIVRSISIENPSIFYTFGPSGNNLNAMIKTISQSQSNTTETVRGEKTKSNAPKKVMINKFFLNKPVIKASIENIANATITLPDIYLQNVGKSSGGVTIENAYTQILRELNKSISKTNLKRTLKDLKGLPADLEDIQSTLDDKLDSLKKSFKKLF